MKKLLLTLLLLAAPALAQNNGVIEGTGPTYVTTVKFGAGANAFTNANYIATPAASCPAPGATNWTLDQWASNTNTGTTEVPRDCEYNYGPDLWLGLQNGSGYAAWNGTGYNSGIAIADGVAHHLELACSGGNTLYLFVDGVLGANMPVTASCSMPSGTVTTANLGRYSSSDFHWTGGIAEVATWSITRHTAAFAPPTAAYAGTETGLVTLYHLAGNALDSAASSGGSSSSGSSSGGSGGSGGSSNTSSSSVGCVPTSGAPAALVQCAFAQGSDSGQPVTPTLAAAPTSGHLLTAVTWYNESSDYDVRPPDGTWTCQLGGRGNGVSTRVNSCTHIVVPGDPAAYTFTSNTTSGQGGIAIALMETSGLATSQIAYSYSTSSGSSTATTATLTPTAAGSFAFALTIGTGVESAAPSGWVALNGVANAIVQTTSTSPVSVTMPIGNTYGGTISALILLAPGTFAQPAVLSPLPGIFSSNQSVTLTCPDAGCTVHYTLDGSTPTCSSTTYAAPIALTATTTINNLVCATGHTNSAIQFSQFVIGAGTLQGVALGVDADLHGYVPWSGDLWHQDISSVGVDPNSASTMSFLQAQHNPPNIRFDNSIPYIVVDSSITGLSAVECINTNTNPVVWDQCNGQADITKVPIPGDSLPVEGSPPDGTYTGDNHSIMIDRTSHRVYELWRTIHKPRGAAGYAADDITGFDLDLPTTVQRTYGYTSADAGGLSVFEGLLRYDEVYPTCKLNHAIRFTASVAGANFVDGSGYGWWQFPATHSSPTGSQPITATDLVYYGMRLRLNASFDTSSYSPAAQCVLGAMKKWGLILADLGQTFDFQGTPDSRWPGTLITELGIAASHFDVVQKNTIYSGAQGAYDYPGYPPDSTTRVATISSFTAASPSIAAGQCTTLTPVVSGQTTMYIDKVGFIRGAVPVCPVTTTTYTLTANGLNLANDDGFDDGQRPTAQVTVTVGAAPTPATSPFSGNGSIAGNCKP